jgi:adenylate kinase family enzyme
VTERVVITGGPRVGKSTLAFNMMQEKQCSLYGTDSLVRSHDWSAASEEASFWFDRPGPWIIEGVAVPRALRKWLERHRKDSSPPCEVLMFGQSPKVQLLPGQISMAKGVVTVLGEIRAELRRRGVRFEPF